MGLPSFLLPAPNSYILPESVDIDVGWPTSLLEGRGQAVSFGPKRMNEVSIDIVRALKMN